MTTRGSNFYRRDPLAALNGMVNLSLEEKAVYNVVIDLLYATWRPLEDNRAFIAGWCGCAVQKVNPIIRSLIAKGKLLSYQEEGQTYLSNAKFEAERKSVKGKSAKPDRGEVEEKSDRSPTDKPTSTAPEAAAAKENNDLTPLEKSREEESREPPVSPPGGDEVREAFDSWNELAERAGLSKAVDLTPGRRKAIGARLKAAGPAGWAKALEAVERSAFCRGQRPGNDGRTWRADLDFVCQAKSFQRLREGYYGDDAKATKAAQTLASAEPWTGPAEFRADVVAQHGEEFARSYLDPSGWKNGDDRHILARTGMAADRMARELRPLLARHAISVKHERAVH